MNTARFGKWFQTRMAIADHIVADFPEVGVEDAEILLCCTASAFAAQMWPGERIDRARFTQYLVEFSDPGLDLSLISVPVLQEKLRDGGDLTKSIALEDHFYPGAQLRLLDPEEAHRTEIQIQSLISGLSTRDIRLCSLVSIIYSDFRSGLVHEYSLSPYLSSIPGKDLPDRPSYMNWLVQPEEGAVEDLMNEEGITREEVEATYVRQVRRLHLPHGFIRTAVSSASTNALAFWDVSTSWRRAVPNQWWLDGGPFSPFQHGA